MLLGVGDGTFAVAEQFAAGHGPRSVAIGDLDDNQMLDLAVVNNISSNLTVLLNQRPVPGDIDVDDDVDLHDFARFAGCMGGPRVTTPPPGCEPADFELADLRCGDGEVALNDYALFQQRFSGPL
ncbi:MAG: hypothetical protein IIC51_11455 [Planctomycetes bacterium]|nr:hypothetical protein [Planctomycetota bacterium]